MSHLVTAVLVVSAWCVVVGVSAVAVVWLGRVR